ncbi:MAG: hypothetical protein JNK15_01985, partial [Planctomycetes bacterium]|nr:hypothetical protein [Planctomycetota bacterium]
MPRNAVAAVDRGASSYADRPTGVATQPRVVAFAALFVAQWVAAIVGSVEGGVHAVDQSIAWFASG